MTARELLAERIADLEDRDFPSLVRSVNDLADKLGSIELTPRAEAFLRWFIRLDSHTHDGLLALLACLPEVT